jgi:GPH family glycoside/pentoside/hexuronide:cation symporter
MGDPRSSSRLSAVKPLPIWRKIAWRRRQRFLADLDRAGAAVSVFPVNIVGLDPAAAGIAIGIRRIWDAFSDIFIGTLSDRTRSRWGRRPYLLFGAIRWG